MAKSSTAHFIGAGPDSDHEVSGIRSSRIALERQTAKVPKVDLERLLAEEREHADLEEVDDTMVIPPSSQGPTSQDTTLRLRAPSLPPGLPSPLGSDFPPPAPELTAIMKFTPVPIPTPLPSQRPSFDQLRAARDEAKRTKRLVVAIWAFALTLTSSLAYLIATYP